MVAVAGAREQRRVLDQRVGGRVADQQGLVRLATCVVPGRYGQAQGDSR